MLPSKASTTARNVRPTGMEERQAIARLSFALTHVLRLYRVAAVSCGHPTGAISALEEQLGKAQLPDEYIEIAREIASMKAPPPTAAVGGLSPGVHGRIASLLRDMARALAMPRLEDEILALASGPATNSVDPEPLLAVARRLVQSLLVQKSTTEILEDCLDSVDGGIQRMAQEEVGVGERLSAMRERLVGRPDQEDVYLLRRTLIEETSTLERLVADRRRALDDLQRQSRMAQRRAERLLAALADATTAACTDPLTGLGNRRALSEAIVQMAASPAPLGLLALDLDHFKRINDTYGHGGGDRVLVQAAEALRTELRGDDLAFRIGGEELLVLLPRCEEAGALATAERIRERVASMVTTVGNQTVRVTVSIGVALWKPGASFEATHDAADEALYEAKRGGRNRCVVA